ncbi:Hsp70 family protein [Nocardia takedensis]
MTEIFGIDLGTTYSVIARIDEFGQPIVINNADGSATTPSAVYFEPGSGHVVVGQEAKNAAKVEADRVVTLVKLHMGEEYRLDFDGKEYTPESISALILQKLASSAEEATGVTVEQVVITVPAYFGVREREATRQAGEIAGLDVVGIVTEPVAAALAYGVKLRDERKTVFIYDLGGGTFDTTILEISPEALDVVAIDGNRQLGGAHWDERVVAHVNQRFIDETGVAEDPLDDDYFAQFLYEQVERAKISLSHKEKAVISLKHGDHRAKIELTRTEFEELTSGLLNQTLEIVGRTVEAAKAKNPALAIDEVLLVGGSSQMPVVAAMLKDRFGWDSRLADPNMSVAKGAAIYAQLPEDSRVAAAGTSSRVTPDMPRLGPGGQPVETRRISNVLPKGVGIQFARGKADSPEMYIGFVAHKNDKLPLSETIRAGTFQDNQTAVSLEVFEQGGEIESELPADNREISPEGGARFVDLPPLPRSSPIDIELTIDSEGLVHVEAFEPVSGQRLFLDVKVAVLQDEDVEAAKQTISQLTLET